MFPFSFLNSSLFCYQALIALAPPARKLGGGRGLEEAAWAAGGVPWKTPSGSLREKLAAVPDRSGMEGQMVFD